ncbi:GAF domain-containing protein [Anaerosalibacter massiliensis]|uniref:GAF domain-containing protein n=1 Tax=Anaerosalibacter massiliensis TaxID=1347392 RepID=A0A9X2MGQ8_9FIRM|nr:GAF domain-containing protein [Anaerosalibacter massiliensis]MCR2043324.1 GAF domain-containing protein [Anaerosalibacter massiliensis]
MEDGNYKIYDLNNLLRTIKSISKAKNFKSISEIIFNFIESLIKYDMAVIYNIDWKRKELEVVSCRGSDIDKLKRRVHIRFGEGAVGWVAEKKKVLLIDDVFKTEKIQVRQFLNYI